MGLQNKKSMSGLLRVKTGVSITQFAKNNKTSRKSVYDALDGMGSRRIRVAIAKTLGLPPSMLWQDNDTVTKMVDDLHYIDAAK